MHNRGTYQDSKKGGKSIERYTMTGGNNHLAMSQPKTNQISSQVQRMTKTIVFTLHKLAKDSKRQSTDTYLKGNSKSLLSAIATLIGSFDNNFKFTDLESDMIIDIYKFIGYPNNINKTILQPIGAPHTWPVCLQLLEWLCQLANYYFAYRVEVEEHKPQEDMNLKIIESYAESDETIFKNYIESNIQQALRNLEQITYNYENKLKAKKNINNAQKDLATMEAEKTKQDAMLFRTNQQVIELDQQNLKLDEQNAKILREINEQNRIAEMHEATIANLQKEINNQEMSVEEVEKCKFQIRQFKEKISQLKNNHQRDLGRIQNEISMAINNFCQIQAQISQPAAFYSKMVPQMEKRKIQIQVPTFDRNEFINYLRNKSEEGIQSEMHDLLNIRKLQKVTEVQETLAQRLRLEFKELNQKCSELQKKLFNQKKFNQEIKAKREQLRNKTEALKLKKDTTLKSIQDIELMQQRQNLNIETIKKKNAQMIQTQASLDNQFSNNLKKIEEILDFKKKFDYQAEQTQKRLKEKLAQYKRKIIQIVQNENAVFAHLNTQFANS